MKSFHLGSKETYSDTIFILKKIGCSIHILKLVGPSECYLLDFCENKYLTKSHFSDPCSLCVFRDHQSRIEKEIQKYTRYVFVHHSPQSNEINLSPYNTHVKSTYYQESTQCFLEMFVCTNVYLHSFPQKLN